MRRLTIDHFGFIYDEAMKKPDLPLKISEYKLLLVKLVRDQETKKAQGDVQKLIELAECDDDFLLKKWSLLFFIIGGPAVFIGLPLILSLFGLFLPPFLMNVLWFITKGLMLVFLILFSATAFFTLRSKQS